MPPRKKSATTTTKKTTPRVRRVAVKKPTLERIVPATRKAPAAAAYIWAVGRRKEAVARVRLTLKSTPQITINDRPVEHYFPTLELQKIIADPLTIAQVKEQSLVTVRVYGGGSQGQAEAVRLGLARALVKHDADLRIPLKRAGLLHRDPRVKERKKYGLKRARRAPQWQKR